jgi:hypothetical protein
MAVSGAGDKDSNVVQGRDSPISSKVLSNVSRYVSKSRV